MRAFALLLLACHGSSADGTDATKDVGSTSVAPGCDGYPDDPPVSPEPSGTCPGGGTASDLAVGLAALQANGQECAVCPRAETVVRATVVNVCDLDVDYPPDCMVRGGTLTREWDGGSSVIAAPDCRVEAGALPPGGRAHEDLPFDGLASGPYAMALDLATGGTVSVRFCVE